LSKVESALESALLDGAGEAMESAGVRLVLPELAPGGLRPAVTATTERARAALTPGARRLVLLSSTAIGGAGPHHPGLVDEETPILRGSPRGIATDWRELELAVARLATDRGTALSVLRTPSIVAPGAPGLFDRMRAGARAPWGRNPPLQLLAADDLAAALGTVARAGADGTFHVVPRATILLRTALATARSRATMRSADRARDPEERAFLAHPWTASGDRLREATGFGARRSSAEALAAALDPDDPAGVPGAGLPDPDPFGMDVEKIRRLGDGPFGFLHDRWWRIEVEGLEHVPEEGPAILVGVHRGFVPFDAIMLLHEMTRRLGRSPRFLVHPGLLKTPFVSRLIARLGGVPAFRANAERLLDEGAIVGVFPEGVRGAFRPVHGVYRLGRFDPEFARLAGRREVPILPVATVGAAEVFPIWAGLDWGAWKRATEWPSFPLTHGMALPLPLPTKWRTRILPPVQPGGAAPVEVAADVRSRMQSTVDELLGRRRSWFTG